MRGDSPFPFRSSDNIGIARSDFAVCVVKVWENGRQTDTGMRVQQLQLIRPIVMF